MNRNLTAGTARVRVITRGYIILSLSFVERKKQNKQRGIRRLHRFKSLAAISHSVPGPFFLRYYPAHRLMAWQPQGTLDDLMLDQIAEWLVHIEKAFFPFKRFVDFSHLTTVAVVPITF